MATKTQMQARSSVNGNLYTWLSTGLDFAGAGFAAAGYPGTPLDVTKYVGSVATPGSLAPMLCAFTAPAPSATLLQGRTVLLTGTISRTATVAVSKGATALGSATVVGLAWSYSYTLLAGDVGPLTFNALATDASSSATGAASVLVTVQATLDKSLFASGIYVPSMPGTVGASMANIPSSSGANVLAVSPTPPTVYQNGVGGNNSARLENSGAPYQYFSCNALGPALRSGTASWTILTHSRLDNFGYKVLWAFARSDNGSSESLILRSNAEYWTLTKTVGGVAVDMTAAHSQDPYSDTMLAIVCNAGVCTAYERSAGQTTERLTALGTLASTALSSAVDTMAFGAKLTTAPGELWTGHLGAVAMAPSALSAGQITEQFDEWTYDNYVGKQANGRGVLDPGDSVMQGPGDDKTGGGMREVQRAFWTSEGLGYWTYGGIEAGGANNGYGEGRQGSVSNTFTSSLAGQSIAQIGTQATLDIANSPALPRYWHCYMGGQATNTHVAPATVCSQFVAQFIASFDAERARDPQAFASITPIIPISSTVDVTPYNPGDTQAGISAVHALWASSVVAPLQARYPGAIYAYDAFLAMGGTAQIPLYFNNDSVGLSGHPNRAGYVQIALHPQYGQLNAVNENGQKLAQRWRQDSPNPARPVALTGSITSPAPAASLPHGTPVTVTFDCSRIGTTPVFKVDGTTIGICRAVEIYDHFVVSGVYAHRPHVQFDFVWTPGVGDVGARSLTATFTDVDGVTVVTSAAVNVSVT